MNKRYLSLAVIALLLFVPMYAVLLGFILALAQGTIAVIMLIAHKAFTDTALKLILYGIIEVMLSVTLLYIIKNIMHRDKDYQRIKTEAQNDDSPLLDCESEKANLTYIPEKICRYLMVALIAEIFLVIGLAGSGLLYLSFDMYRVVFEMSSGKAFLACLFWSLTDVEGTLVFMAEISDSASAIGSSKITALILICSTLILEGAITFVLTSFFALFAL